MHLHVAAQRRSTGITKLLIESGADIESVAFKCSKFTSGFDKDGETPLSLAKIRDKSEGYLQGIIIELLLQWVPKLIQYNSPILQEAKQRLWRILAIYNNMKYLMEMILKVF